MQLGETQSGFYLPTANSLNIYNQNQGLNIASEDNNECEYTKYLVEEFERYFEKYINK